MHGCRRVAVEGLIGDFLAYMELERGLSRNTLEAYRSDLLQLAAFLRRRDLDVLEVTHAELSAFFAELSAGDGEHPPVAPATLARKVACVRSFYRHLRMEGAIEHDPTAELRGPRKGQRLPRVLSRDQVARLLASPRGSDPLALRDRALLELMYACGLRASEAIGLELADVDFEEGLLRARGKGSKERIVPIGSRALAALGAYCRAGRPVLLGNGAAVAAVPQPPGGAADQAGPLQDRPGSRPPRGPRAADEPPHAAPHLRHPPAQRAAATCARCRRCWATPTWPPPSSTPTSPRTASRTPTSRPPPRRR